MQLLTFRQEGLFMALAECDPDTGRHVPKALKDLLHCVAMDEVERVMYRRIRLLARDTENALRAAQSIWCIANHGSGFVMRLRSRTPRELMADVVKPTGKPRKKNWQRKPRRKNTRITNAKRTTWSAKRPRIALDPNRFG